MKSLTSVALLLVLLLSTGIAQQTKEKKDEKQPAPLAVKLNVTVIDSTGHQVNNLTQNQFRVFEDDVPQTLSLFQKKEGPVNYVLAVDTSGSMRAQLSKVVDTTRLVIANTPADGKVLLLRFISSDKIETVTDFTSDPAPLTRGLNDLYVEGGESAIVDAVYLANEKIEKFTKDRVNVRRSLVLITDGEERNSFYKKAQLFVRLKETGIQVFIVGFIKELSKREREKAVNFLNGLAVETGGHVFYPVSSTDFQSVATEIMSEMRAPYVLGYDSANPARDGSWRKVRIEIVNQPADVKLTAVARAGYVAPKN